MQRERITDHIFVFRSDQYAQVTAGVVLTDDGAVLIDTLLYPEETVRIRRYVEDGLGASVNYVINTHFHADHTTGTCFFPGAQVIAHKLCRELLDRRGRNSLRQMKKAAPEFEPVRLVLPDITFEEQMTLKIGATRFLLRESPGHSPDSIICLLEEEEVLFAADTVMPIPYFVDGSFSDSVKSLSRLLESEYEHIVQGHGDIILRGEVPGKIASDLEYLHRIDEAVKVGLDKGQEDIENQVSLAHCGKSHVLLNGVVQQLHQHNVRALVNHYRDESEEPPASRSEDKAERSYAWHQKKLI
ncbi:MAG: MBL fold metallo-hydrolase [Chloroflexi bacterium]|nr:MBL fold metallo-hydrolase [Chloroflexota bacterium]